MNILLRPFETVHHTAPFTKIRKEDYLPAFHEAIAETKEEIQAICSNSERATFQNTVEQLVFSGMILDQISNIFFNLHSAETNDDLDQIAQQVAPLLAELGNDITLNQTLFDRIKSVYQDRDKLDLNAEKRTLLDKYYRDFVRNGALLDEEKKRQLREIDKELSVLTLQFGEHVLADTNAYQLHLTQEEDLEGLPEGAIEAARDLAEQKGLEGWIFTLDYPSYIPFMTYAKNRALRQELAESAGRRGFQKNENNNENIVLKITHLRHQRAGLLGYPSHAHFVLEERMAKDPGTVKEFLNELLEKSKPAAIRELDQLKSFAKDLDGLGSLEKWDAGYYSEKLKQQLFSLDDEKLKPYFSLDNVLSGVFQITQRLYGIHFKEVQNIERYHDQVRTFEVLDDQDQFLAVLYADFFPRKGKRNGAWMTSFKPQYKRKAKNHRPHVSIVCNFTPPTSSKPSLLTFNEVTTLFHEFGHALHGMLADTEYPNLSGANVFWDFVELPSQVMENWCYQPEALQLFARHYQTGEVIPMEYIQKIKDSASFMEGMATLRQISFGLLDMGWHAQNPSTIESVKDFELAQFASTALFPDVRENAMSTAFSHIFNGGYSAGYYSYKWAEVLDADAFSYFEKEGIFNPEVAQKFRTLLAKGGTEHPMELYKIFRGQEPSIEPLLIRAGLMTTTLKG
ncbi:MAG: M3 family metallopeptidase [Sphingobacterium sp.]